METHAFTGRARLPVGPWERKHTLTGTANGMGYETAPTPGLGGLSANEMAQELIKPYNRKLREKWKNDGYGPVYIAAREINSEGRVHYHEAWFLNGHKTWKTYERFKESEQVLQRVIGPDYDAKGLIDHCDNGHRNGITKVLELQLQHQSFQ